MDIEYCGSYFGSLAIFRTQPLPELSPEVMRWKERTEPRVAPVGPHRSRGSTS
jgi:hypothetical protein